MGRKLSLLLLITILISSFTMPAWAAPGNSAPSMETVTIQSSSTSQQNGQSDQQRAAVDYSGPLDPLTGLPVTNSSAEDPSYVVLKEGSFGYDQDRRCFVNVVGSRSFNSNIPNGAILSVGRHKASFTIPTGLAAKLYCNGELQSEADLTNITQPGSYILEVSVSNTYDSSSFSFRILDEKTNAITEFALPSGFAFESVLKEKEALTPDYQNYTQLLEDGSYEISWSNTEVGQSYTTTFVLDTLAPVLALPEVENGEAHSEVTLTDLEAGAYVVLKEKSTGETKTITSATTEIKNAGTYHLTVYDAAGNFTEYDFTIHVYFNLSAIAAICLMLAGVAGLAIYSRYIRKHPRVG